MVRAVHLPVTVQAVLAHDETSARQIRVSEIEQTPDVVAATTTTAPATVTMAATVTAAEPGNPAMTLLAQLRTLAIQQRRMVRAMHVVAQGAVLRDREVLPQEGLSAWQV